MQEWLLLDLVRNAFSVLLLAYACAQDLKDREIDDRTWKLLLAGAAAINSLGVIVGSVDAATWLILATLQSLVFWALHHFGAYGGADAECLICLSFMYPTTIDHVIKGLTTGSFTTAVSTFDNAIVLSLTYIPLNLLINAGLMLRGVDVYEGLEKESVLRRIGALFLLRKTSASELSKDKDKFMAAERLDDQGIRHIAFSRNVNDERSSDSTGEGSNYEFATPLMPLLLFILAGFVVERLYGDLLLSFSLGLLRFVSG